MDQFEKLESKINIFKKAAEISEGFLNECKKLSTDSHVFKSKLGEAFYMLRDYEEALTLLTSSFEIQENNNTASRIALCYSRMSKPIEALTWINKAIAIAPEGNLSAHIIGREIPYKVLQFNFLVKSGRIDEAQTLLEQKTINDNDSMVLSASATIKMLKGNFQEASQLLQSAYEISDETTKIEIKEQLILSEKLSSTEPDLIPLVERTIMSARWPD
ncbi:tetratricopeptide repeat protein [Saccharicrinis fermentans]|uniref:Putative PEP-CTERM system TPR-repeat lipoprotein n=1 Tax=Saccharicrinis fermentans DSM 9555 = JCM 21142 TaxID=869213 RepID=W7YDB1_9BACT|nr:tetratricopeptide repeat protein [Saccharicrinis fermentans]GAF05483.1 putative PEP-CTERM system TPR-repeat lipoprotein [Saccharicrinis fermentans DSM 9555 = JCM 21142]